MVLFHFFLYFLAWSEIPGVLRFNRKTRKTEYTARVREILLYLAPASAFNPNQIWEQEKERDRQIALLAEEKRLNEESKLNKKKGKGNDKLVIKAGAKIVEENKKKRTEDDFLADITRIRNSKDKLISILGQFKNPKTRLVLMMEILKKAYEKGEKEVIFEALWAIDEVGCKCNISVCVLIDIAMCL